MDQELISFPIEIVESISIDSYENVLCKFSQWTSIKREISLNGILDGKKIQFDIEDIKSFSNILFGCFENLDSEYLAISKACFLIKSMSFVIKGKTVESLIVKIQILTTEYGKKLSNIISDGIDVSIHQRIINKQVAGFYVSGLNFNIAA